MYFLLGILSLWHSVPAQTGQLDSMELVSDGVLKEANEAFSRDMNTSQVLIGAADSMAIRHFGTRSKARPSVMAYRH